MKSWKKLTLGGFAVPSICLLVALFFDALSIMPAYRQETARIISVQDDSKWGYIGEDKRTLVEWGDGLRDYIPGAMGEPGETIRAQRRDGDSSLFGWTGDRRRLFKTNAGRTCDAPKETP